MFIHPTPKPALKTAISILSDAFGDYAQVSAKMPTRAPDRFVRVSRIGGSRPFIVTDAAKILIEWFGPDPETVESMTATVDEAMHNAVGTVIDGAVFVRGWDNVQGPTDFPHPDLLSWDRWQVNGDLLVSTSTPADGPPGS